MNAAKPGPLWWWPGLRALSSAQTDGFLDFTIGPGGPHHHHTEPMPSQTDTCVRTMAGYFRLQGF